MTNLDSILKIRDITFSTKVCLFSAVVFPVVKYGCESWTIKKAEHWRIDAFELWCWRRVLRVPLTARRFNQEIGKEISPEYSLEGLMLKLKLEYFGLLMWRSNSLENTMMVRKNQGRRRRGRQRVRWLNSITNSLYVSLNKLWEIVKDRVVWHAVQSMESQTVRHELVTEQQQTTKIKNNSTSISCLLDPQILTFSKIICFFTFSFYILFFTASSLFYCFIY